MYAIHPAPLVQINIAFVFDNGSPSVNLAARLMAHIQNSSIVVDDNVRRMLSHSSAFKPLNPVTAKGNN